MLQEACIIFEHNEEIASKEFGSKDDAWFSEAKAEKAKARAERKVKVITLEAFKST